MRFIVPVILGLAFATAALQPTPGTAAEPKTKPSAGKLKADVKPKKGIIYIKGKRITSCTDWGRDKGWCSKNNK